MHNKLKFCDTAAIAVTSSLRVLKVLLLLLICSNLYGIQRSYNMTTAASNVDTNIYRKKIRQLLEQSTQAQYESPMLAFENSVKAVYLAEQIADTNCLIEALNQGGVSAYYSGYIGKSAKYFARSVQLLEKRGPSVMLANTYNNLGAIYQHGNNEPDSAIAYNKRAIELFQALNNSQTDTTYSSALSQAYSNIGHVYLGEEKYPEAEQFFKASLNIESDSSLYQRGIPSSQFGLAEVYLNTNRMEYAWELIKNAEQYCYYWRDYTLIPAADYAKGQWHEKQGNLIDAIHFYTCSIEQALADSTFTSIKELAEILSELYQRLEQEDKALKFLQLSINAAQEVDKQQAATELTKMELEKQFSQWEKEIQEEVKYRKSKHLTISLTGILLALIAIGLLFIARRQKRRTQLLYLNSKMRHEQVILEKEKLSLSVEEMEKKLARQLLERMTRNELIEATIKKLLELYRMPKLTSRHPLQEIAGSLRDIQDHSIWEEFEYLYANTNSNWFKHLNQFDNLTLNDRRLCIFLHMNMMSKEISALTGQSIKAIEVARTRLRKKLDLTNSNISLHDFLASLGEDALEEHTFTKAISQNKS
jgi:tetratricopeptide (TPR) repeat protein